MLRLQKIIMIVLVCLCAVFLYGKNNKNKTVPDDIIKVEGPYKRDYFVLLPKNFDPERRYWLFVAVHGYGGDGLVVQGQRRFPFRDQCIIVGPSFPQSDADGGYYQMLGGNADKQLLGIVKELKKKYKLYDRFLLYGFSGGSQFSHRFTMKNHKLVLACSSHSGGSWTSPSSSAKYLPFAISCGEKDTKRLGIYRKFFDQMRKGKYFYTARIRPGAGHGPGPWIREKTAELFALTTTGLYPKQREELDSKISEIRTLIKNKKSNRAKAEIAKLKSFRPSKLKYTPKPIDDTDEKRSKKYTESVNEYGYTTNSKAEKYLQGRLKYYLDTIVIPELSNQMQ